MSYRIDRRPRAGFVIWALIAGHWQALAHGPTIALARAELDRVGGVPAGVRRTALLPASRDPLDPRKEPT